jgi:hypothetical protein
MVICDLAIHELNRINAFLITIVEDKKGKQTIDDKSLQFKCKLVEGELFVERWDQMSGAEKAYVEILIHLGRIFS